MADSGGQNLQQQGLRRQYDGTSVNYQHQHQYYNPYNAQYSAYPAQMNAHQYHQAMPPHHQWTYYNQNPYMRAQPAYQPYNQYPPYSHPSSFPPRPVVSTHQQYRATSRAPHESPATHATSAQSVHHPNHPPHPHPPPPPPPPPQVPPTPPLDPRPSQSPVPSITFSGHHAPYYPPLPWLSVPEQQFPPRQRRSRRRPRSQSASKPVELPARLSTVDTATEERASAALQDSHSETGGDVSQTKAIEEVLSPDDASEVAVAASRDEPDIAKDRARHVPGKSSTSNPQKFGAVIPVIPNLAPSVKSPVGIAEDGLHPSEIKTPDPAQASEQEGDADHKPDGIKVQAPKQPAKSWAQLLKAPTQGNSQSGLAAGSAMGVQDSLQRRYDSLGQAISSFTNAASHKLSFLEPRGLVNSGNMCYMNSILQALLACVPFYNFLSHVSRHVVYSFKSDTPLLDALIMFMKEFNIIDAAESAEKLRMRLKPMELEQFGESLLPEYVYEEIRRMPRFATMQRGHQQDAEEFLGFLFEELQGECAKAIRRASPAKFTVDAGTAQEDGGTGDDGWLEVGPKQRASTTRSSGVTDVDTPVNRIFGGQLRSELRVPGAKNSVTLEPYQSLQLDIGSPEVRTIVDALKGLTKPETLHGDFQSPRGSGATATKQVFVEALPPVLILHLKRFQYDNTGGTQKIWKSVGYPLQLEVPKEVFPHTKRGSFAAHGGLPKYRLTSVIYHHGKSATAGHYTTDILRQDGKEWLRIDDTFIRRVRSHDVESAGEDASVALAAALERHHKDATDKDQSADDGQVEGGLDGSSEKGWSQARTGSKKWSGIVNGTSKSSGVGTPTGQQTLKDSKVAYILFYEKIESSVGSA